MRLEGVSVQEPQQPYSIGYGTCFQLLIAISWYYISPNMTVHTAEIAERGSIFLALAP